MAAINEEFFRMRSHSLKMPRAFQVNSFHTMADINSAQTATRQAWLRFPVITIESNIRTVCLIVMGEHMRPYVSLQPAVVAYVAVFNATKSSVHF